MSPNFDLSKVIKLNDTKNNKAFIIEYYNAISGVIKTDEICKKYIADQKLIENIKFFDGAFPCYELFIDEMIAEDDKVILRGRATGIHKAEFKGIPATHKEMNLPFIARYTIKNEKIVDFWLLADQTLLMQQLGIVK